MTARAPDNCELPPPGPALSAAPPRTMTPAPRSSRRDRDSPKTSTANPIVRGASRFRRSDAWEPGNRASPNSRRSGPAMPPRATIAASVGRSWRRIFDSRPARRMGAANVKPKPAPRYRRPAIMNGPVDGSSHLATGVESPKRTAALRPVRAPRSERASGMSKSTPPLVQRGLHAGAGDGQQDLHHGDTRLEHVAAQVRPRGSQVSPTAHVKSGNRTWVRFPRVRPPGPPSSPTARPTWPVPSAYWTTKSASSSESWPGLSLMPWSLRSSTQLPASPSCSWMLPPSSLPEAP